MDKTRALLVALAVGDTYEEIAERTGQSKVAVRKSAERARKTEASRLRARGRHDIGIWNLMIAAGLLAVFAVFFGPSERRHMIQQTITGR
jgi:hypothetical protein